MFSSRRTQYVIWACLFLLGIFFPIQLLAGQETNTHITQTQTIEPDTVDIDQEALYTLRLQGGTLTQCTTNNSLADIALLIDVSGTMSQENRLIAAKQAAIQFVDNINLTTSQIAIVAFARDATVEQSLTQDQTALQQAITRLHTINGGTEIEEGLQEASEALRGEGHRSTANSYIILLSDGDDSDEVLVLADEIKAQGTQIFTISLGPTANRDLMGRIASTKDNHYSAEPTDLERIYSTIGGRIAESVATNVVITTTLNNENVTFDSNDLSPAGITNGSQIVWTLPSLSESEIADFSVRLRPVQPGSFPAAESIQIAYLACGEQPTSLSSVSSPLLTVLPLVPTATPIPTAVPTPLPSPCELDPLSNECANTLVCVGPVTLPCTITDLPWWVCLLLFLLLLLALIFWWLWRKRHTHDKPNPLPELEIPEMSLPESSSIDPVSPTPLKITSPPKLSPPSAALIIGLGELGQGVLSSLQDAFLETYDDLPVSTKLLHVNVKDIENIHHEKQTLILPLNQAVFDLIKEVQDKPTEWPHLTSWLSLSGSGLQKQAMNEEHGRSLCRLSLFLNQNEVRQRIAKEIRSLNLGSGQRLELFLVSSMIDAVGSGLLVDITHMARLEADGLSLKTAAYSITLLPNTTIGEESLRKAAFAHWRELNRFQLVFASEYPIVYASNNRRTKRQGRLFERNYLISQERDGGPSLTSVPLDKGLYPAVADFLMAMLDSPIRTAWEEVYQSIDGRLNDKQVQRKQALYNSMGSTTYVLPVDTLVYSARLDLLDEVIEAQLADPGIDPSDIVVEYWQEPSDDDLPTTLLFQSLGRLAKLSANDTSSEVDKWHLDLTNLLAPNEHYRTLWQELRPFVNGDLVRGIATAFEAEAQDEAEYHEIFVHLVRLAQLGYVFETLDNVDDIIRYIQELGFDEDNESNTVLNQVTPWSKGAVKEQQEIFTRRIANKLKSLLARNRSQNSIVAGISTARAFLSELFASLTRIDSGVQVAIDSRTQQLTELSNQIDAITQQMNEAKENTYRNLGLPLGLAIGLGIPTLIVLAVGIASLFWVIPTSLLLVSLGFVLLGGYWTYHRLFIPSKLSQLEAQYRDLVTEQVPLAVETYLYQELSGLIRQMQETTQEALNPLNQWIKHLETIQAEDIKVQRQELHARREARKQFLVRHYLEDEHTERSIRQKFMSHEALPSALERIQWQQLEDGFWKPQVYGTTVHLIHPADVVAVREALIDLTLPYASQIYSASIASLLLSYEEPASLAETVARDAAPFIQVNPEHQPDMVGHRFVCVQSDGQTVYFQKIVDALQEPATMHHTQQLTGQAAHPHRFYVLSSLDLLAVEGLPSWQVAKEAYHHDKRELVHIFPAEKHTALWESTLSRLRLAVPIFSPYTCLVLENETRAYAFGWAYAFKWLKESEDASRRERAWILALPKKSPLPLVTTRDGAPSLWQALVNYNLLPNDDSTEMIKVLISELIQADPETRRQIVDDLEQRREQIKDYQQHSPLDEPIMSELFALIHLVVEDLIRRVEHTHPLLDWLSI